MSTVSFGAHFPGYEILGEIGRANARVLKARHIDSGDFVAIKHFFMYTDDDTLRRFQREAEIMTAIRHPNVVKVRELSIENSMPYLVMDWIEGGDLRGLLRERKQLDAALTIRIGLQIAAAFQLIHEKGIVHRDVKPENILYRHLQSGELQFLLTDFGIAKLQDQRMTVTGQSLLTYEYASPEQFDSPHRLNEATDYYSLGVVLYECLQGKVPFSMEGTGMGTFINNVLTVKPETLSNKLISGIPESIGLVVDKMLAKDPDERLHDANDFIYDLKRAELDLLRPNRTQVKDTTPSNVIETPRKYTEATPTNHTTPYTEKSTPSNEEQTKVIVLPPYAQVRNFQAGLAKIQNKNGQWGFMDKAGREIVPLIYSRVDPYSEGRSAAISKNKVGFIDESGQVSIPFEYNASYSFSEGLASVEKSDYAGFINRYGEVTISFEYFKALSFKENLAAVKKTYNTGWGYIDPSGEVIIPFDYNAVQNFSEGLAIVEKNNKKQFIDRTGRTAFNLDYEGVGNFSEGLSGVRNTAGKWGFIDKKGQVVVPLQYDIIGNFKGGLAAVVKGTMGGFIDKSGRQVIPLQYDAVKSFHEGLAAVKKQGKWGFINSTGQTVIQINKDEVSDFQEGLAIVVQLTKKFLRTIEEVTYIDKLGRPVLSLVR